MEDRQIGILLGIPGILLGIPGRLRTDHRVAVIIRDLLLHFFFLKESKIQHSLSSIIYSTSHSLRLCRISEILR